MKKVILGLLLLTSSVSASEFNFDACSEKWRIRHDTFQEILWLDKYDTNSGTYKGSVNRAYDSIVKSNTLPEQFLGDFVAQVNTKLAATCEANGGGEVPTEWAALLSYLIGNKVAYDESTEEIYIKQ